MVALCLLRPPLALSVWSRLGIGLCLALGWCAPLAAGERAELTVWGTVTQVQSATRLALQSPDAGLLKLRLFGVQAPEPPNPRARGEVREGQPFGDQTFAFIRNLLLGRQVQIRSYGSDHGRLLVVVWLGDINVNLELVKQGLAWMEPSLRILAVRAPLEVAERQAQVGHYGFWELPNPEPPWEFRRRNRLPAE